MPRADAQQFSPAATGPQPVAIRVSKAKQRAKTIVGKTRRGAKQPSQYKAKPDGSGKKATGRPSDYDPKYAQQAEVLMREHGLTEPELAKALLTSPASITNWKNEHPEFIAAINKGRDAFDSVKVRQALRSRALGYEYEESEEGYSEKQGAWTKTAKKKLAADVTACIFWLVNRQPDDWKHVARTIIQGDPKNPVAHKYEFDLSKLPEKELAQLESIVAKARADKATGSDAPGNGRVGNGRVGNA